MGQLSVNLERSLELQMAGVIGCRSKVEQPSCSPGFLLRMQTTEIAVGVLGTIVGTTDGGNIWVNETSGTGYDLSRVSLSTAVGYGSTILEERITSQGRLQARGRSRRQARVLLLRVRVQAD